jgi:TolA-binding protein
MLDIGEASSRLRWDEYDQAIQLLAAVTDRQPDGVFAAEAIYWRGIATYLKTQDNEEMYRVWQEIVDRFPETVWAKRVP